MAIRKLKFDDLVRLRDGRVFKFVRECNANKGLFILHGIGIPDNLLVDQIWLNQHVQWLRGDVAEGSRLFRTVGYETIFYTYLGFKYGKHLVRRDGELHPRSFSDSIFRSNFEVL